MPENPLKAGDAVLLQPEPENLCGHKPDEEFIVVAIGTEAHPDFTWHIVKLRSKDGTFEFRHYEDTIPLKRELLIQHKKKSLEAMEQALLSLKDTKITPNKTVGADNFAKSVASVAKELGVDASTLMKSLRKHCTVIYS